MSNSKSCRDELGALKYLRVLNELREFSDVSHEELEELYFVAKAEFERNPGIIVPSMHSDDDFLPVDQKWGDLDAHMMVNLIVRQNLVFFFPAFVKMMKKRGRNG